MTALDFNKRSVQLVTVPAKLAVEFLARNHDNRPISAHRVRGMVEKMQRLADLRATLNREPTEAEIVEANAWLFTSQGFGFDNTGRMIDGQHRLTAQVRVGLTLDWVVTTGLAPAAFDRTDVGDIRSAADLLSRRVPDLKNKSMCAASARYAIMGLSAHDVDKIIVVDFVEHHAAMIDGFAAELRKNRTTCRAPVVAAFVAAARPLDCPFEGPKGARHIDLLMLTAMRLARQEWLARKDDPIKTLHNRLVADERAALKSGRMTDPKTLYSLTVSAIRAELSNRGLLHIPGTDIDWGDPRDNIREGTGDLAGKRSKVGAAAWAEGRRVRDPARLSLIAKEAAAKREKKLAETAAETRRPAVVRRAAK